jgi:hypothetical protein
MTCAHFTELGKQCCSAGIDYMKLAGGGTFTLVLRLPCLPISNRRGEVARACAKYQAQGANDKTGEKA